MKTEKIRQTFLDYFAKHGHHVVASSALVPTNDPTLLFTNAGMVQFKDVFLGHEQRPYQRAVSSQRCVRAGGKHNDLENVGFTARHHTFFEMLGNFSFGDYFKREAIRYAWHFLTEVLAIPPEKLWVTVYEDDEESAAIWLEEIGVSPARFSRCGEKDNFWSMGDTGPCGPCTEIFYDHGPEIPGQPPGQDDEGDRYVEVWNLVFMQYQRDETGKLTPLPKPSVDTGMGLERIAAVLQGVHSNYDIDLFQQLIHAAADITHTQDKQHASLKVIADHIRSCAFLILDGVLPGNEGRGYVLRRIIRRALRHGNKLGVQDLFFYRLVAPLADVMGEAYPELIAKKTLIETEIQREEEQFSRTLDQGLKVLADDIAHLKKGQQIHGSVVFKLYDTYGFPVDLTRDIAREQGLLIDIAGFEEAMAKQRKQSQAAKKFATDYNKTLAISHGTEFLGYENLQKETTALQFLLNGEVVKQLQAGDSATVVLAHTPFYGEGGGQVGDSGKILFPGGMFMVNDTQKLGDAHLHIGKLVKGIAHVNEKVSAQVDVEKRQATMLNHSATHLLHAALRNVLGDHVVQKGSLVDAQRLRFDFAYREPLTSKQCEQLEAIVNGKIRANLPVRCELMTPEQAQQSGAVALFGEKYGEQVRVLSMGDFSKELCGGTHVKDTGDIGLFQIVSETSVAAGVRRIEAVTGKMALAWVKQRHDQLEQLAALLKTPTDKAQDKLEQVLAQLRQLRKENDRLQMKLATSTGADVSAEAENVAGVRMLVTQLTGVTPKALRDTLDQLKNKLSPAVLVLVAVDADTVHVVAGISKACLDKVPPSADYVRIICGKGGGRPDMAQGGGPCPADLSERLAQVRRLIRSSLLPSP